MEKLSKTAKVLYKIIRVLRKISIAAAIVLAVFLIIAAVIPQSQMGKLVNMADEGEMSVIFGSVQLHLTQALAMKGSLKLFLCLNLFMGAAIVLVYIWGLKLLENVLAPMKDARPFDTAVSANLWRLGILTIVSGALHYVLNYVSSYLAIELYDFQALFAEGMVKGYVIENSFEISYLLVPALIFLLSYVFKYGEQLQKQSDETL